MQFSLDDRTCALSVGEFAGFTLGPRGGGAGGPAGVWRAQLGQHWHGRLRSQTAEQVASGAADNAAFETPLTLGYRHRGWSLTFTGRIDQVVTVAGTTVIREIKTVTCPLPADPARLRGDYPEYFIQAIAYFVLLRSAPRPGSGGATDVSGAFPFALSPALRAELVFVEVATGMVQPVGIAADDEALFWAQVERLVDFLELRRRARERLRELRFRPAFAVLRPGQETIQADLSTAFGVQVPDEKAAAENLRSSPATAGGRPSTIVFFEAPTGYGKTGVLLEFALHRLREGRFSRLLYLTGKSTGQLQVMRTLSAMTAPAPEPVTWDPELHTRLPAPRRRGERGKPEPATTPVAAWQVRPKSEHCVNDVFHCVRDACPYLADLEARWASAGLARFYLRENEAHDLDSLRAAGREARICPYEITRTALPFNDVWVGDYNYVFSPDSRGVFFERPGFNPTETLLVVDEAHNLPSRVADAWSHTVRAGEAGATLIELHRVRPPSSLLLAWEHWARLLGSLPRAESLAPAVEDDVRDAVDRLAGLVTATPLDYAQLGPRASGQLWQTLALRDWLAGDFDGSDPNHSIFASRHSAFPSLLWCPRPGELQFTCLDAAGIIGPTVRAFGGAVLASATLQPAEAFAAACGLGDRIDRSVSARSILAGFAGDHRAPAGQPAPPTAAPEKLGTLNKRQTRKLYSRLTNAGELLQVAEARDAARPRLLAAPTPWRDDAYFVGVDVRVDTTFQHRARHHATTAATVGALCRAAARQAGMSEETGAEPFRLSSPDFRPAAAPVAVFFPSYAYAESIVRALAGENSALRVVLQPRAVDLAAQAAWVEESLASSDALFLVLGSGFTESIDLLGGRIGHAMVVAPALPEVNAIQRSRLAAHERAGLSRAAAFRRVYQIPGMQKVNQALGRLVRAPGQRARVLLHCRRFAESSYADLLAPEYRDGTVIADDFDLAAWLDRVHPR